MMADSTDDSFVNMFVDNLDLDLKEKFWFNLLCDLKSSKSVFVALLPQILGNGFTR